MVTTTRYKREVTDRAPAAPLYELVTATLKITGITKAQLKQRSGVARSTIDLWRTQPRPPQPSTVLAVADALGIDRNEALRLAGVLDEEEARRLDESGSIKGSPPVDLAEIPTDALVEELHRIGNELRRRIPE